MTETHAVTATNIERVMADLVSTTDDATFDFSHATDIKPIADATLRAALRLSQLTDALIAEHERRRS